MEKPEIGINRNIVECKEVDADIMGDIQKY